MLTRLWTRLRGSSGDPDAERLSSLIAAERRRQGLVEAQRRREGGIWDPILGRWVAVKTE